MKEEPHVPPMTPTPNLMTQSLPATSFKPTDSISILCAQQDMGQGAVSSLLGQDSRMDEQDEDPYLAFKGHF